jgi:transcriptional regulator with XRE-family HTH domain
MNNRVTSIHDPRYQSIIDILSQARKSKGVSQNELALKLGFTQPNLSKIESLERRIDVIELLDYLIAVSDGDDTFFDSIWNKINECSRKPSRSRKES